MNKSSPIGSPESVFISIPAVGIIRGGLLRPLIKSKDMSEDPTTPAFTPVTSVKETKKSICFKSRTIGAIEGMFLAIRTVNLTSANFYKELCNELDYDGDKEVLEYIDHLYKITL